MVRFASSDPVMLARQLPLQSVALILAGRAWLAARKV